MNKKILLLLLIPVMLLLTTACDKTNTGKKDTRKSIVLKDEKLGFKTTFKYDQKEKYSDIEEDTSGASTEISFDNEELDIQVQMYYNTMTIEAYNTTKKSRSEKKFYKEYKFGEYDAYAYGDYESSLNLSILLKEEDNNMADVLFVAIDRIDNDKEVIISDVVAGDSLQEFFNSMKFEKIKVKSS